MHYTDGKMAEAFASAQSSDRSKREQAADANEHDGKHGADELEGS